MTPSHELGWGNTKDPSTRFGRRGASSDSNPKPTRPRSKKLHLAADAAAIHRIFPAETHLDIDEGICSFDSSACQLVRPFPATTAGRRDGAQASDSGVRVQSRLHVCACTSTCPNSLQADIPLLHRRFLGSNVAAQPQQQQTKLSFTSSATSRGTGKTSEHGDDTSAERKTSPDQGSGAWTPPVAPAAC